MNHVKRCKILCKLQENNSKPNIELFYRSNFELLIAVLLSTQSSDMQVNRVTKVLFQVANTPSDMVRLGLNNLKSYIKSIGLFNIKANNIIKICHILINNYSGNIPESRSALESFPGVGRKISNVVLNVAFGWPTIAVDRHVFRVCNRTSFAIGMNVFSVEKKLLSVVPKKFKNYCHQWFVLHGRYVCRAKKPDCHICTIRDLCEFKNKIK